MRSRQSLTSSRFAIDVAPVVLVAGVGAVAIALYTPDGHHRGAHPYFLAVVLAENVVALLMRRRHPIGAFAAVLSAYVLFDALAISLAPLALASATVAASASRRVVGLTSAVTALAIVLVPLIHGDPVDVVHVLLPLAVVGLAVAVGRRTANAYLQPVPTS
jgi:hypothetical protein